MAICQIEELGLLFLSTPGELSSYIDLPSHLGYPASGLGKIASVALKRI